MKRILQILLVILILGAVGTLLYSFFLAGDAGEPKEQQSASGVTKLNDDQAISPINSFSGDAIWYGLSDGKLMWYDLNKKSASEYPLPQVLGESFTKIMWPRTGNDFISLGNYEGVPTYNYFQYATRRYATLNKNILSLDWMSDSRRIVVIWKSGSGKTQLVTSNSDGSGYKVLTDLPWVDLVPKASPVNDTALLVRSAPDGEVNRIYLFDLVTGSYSPIVERGKNLAAVWAPKGDRFAFTRLVGNDSKLFIHDMVSGDDTDLGIITSIDKVAFGADGQSMYIAAPRQDSPGEELIRVNLLSNEKTLLRNLDPNIRARNLLAIGQEIYFINSVDGKIYRAN